MRAIAPLNLPLIDQTHVRFVDQRGRLQCVIDRFVPKVTGGDAPELVVHQREQIVERLAAAAAPRHEQLGDVRG